MARLPKNLINQNTSRENGHTRSNRWPAFRRRFLKGRTCAACGGKAKLEAHHIIPFHVQPERELDDTNLIALCEGRKTINCHLILGHGGDYRDYNPDARKDAEHLLWLMKNRQIGVER